MIIHTKRPGRHDRAFYIHGLFRIRIFNDNQQSARVSSEAAEKRFQAMCPGIPTYRTYSNPYFKVVAGDFRTKSEALKVLQTVMMKTREPSARVWKPQYPPGMPV